MRQSLALLPTHNPPQRLLTRDDPAGFDPREKPRAASRAILFEACYQTPPRTSGDLVAVLPWLCDGPLDAGPSHPALTS